MKAESFGIPQNSREIITHYNYNNLIPCGKGNELNNYLGYGRFREKNEQYSEQYHLSRKKDRIEISKRILYELEKEIGPFINIDTGEKISNAKARDKIGHALRVYHKNHPPKKITVNKTSEPNKPSIKNAETLDSFDLNFYAENEIPFIDAFVRNNFKNASTIKGCSNKESHNALALRKISS